MAQALALLNGLAPAAADVTPRGDGLHAVAAVAPASTHPDMAAESLAMVVTPAAPHALRVLLRGVGGAGVGGAASEVSEAALLLSGLPQPPSHATHGPADATPMVEVEAGRRVTIQVQPPRMLLATQERAQPSTRGCGGLVLLGLPPLRVIQMPLVAAGGAGAQHSAGGFVHLLSLRCSGRPYWSKRGVLEGGLEAMGRVRATGRRVLLQTRSSCRSSCQNLGWNSTVSRPRRARRARPSRSPHARFALWPAPLREPP
jgi:hypothetical protein